MLQKILEKILKKLARAVLRKQRPKIVTITGSVGKTSAKEAVYIALKNKFKVRRNIKNYNNEIGVPLTIFGCQSPAKNIFLWKWVILKAVFLSLVKLKRYPQVLVLEIAADKPGDLKYLMEIFPSDLLKAAVLTAVSPAHLEFFGVMQNILKEKTTPFAYLPKNGTAVINKESCDLEGVLAETGRLPFSIFYGLEQAGEMTKRFVFPHQAYAISAAVAVAGLFGINEQEARQILARGYRILAGRGRKIRGINNTTIIDDTYNSSPLSAKMALEALKNFPCKEEGRHIAVLGDMLELGKDSPVFHRQVGERARELNIDYLITYGKEAKNMGSERHFSEQQKLIDFLKGFIELNDVILIKGSQATRMEKTIKALMAEPERAKELLVRQSKKWLKK